MTALQNRNSQGSLTVAGSSDITSAIGSAYTDDFDNGPTIAGTQAFSALPWNVASANSGTLGASSAGGSTNPGVWALGSGGAGGGNGRSGILRGASGAAGNFFIGTTYAAYVEWVSRIPVVSAVGQTFDAALGWGAAINAAGVCSNGLIWRALSTSVWACQVVVGGVVDPLSLTTVIAVPTTWVTLKVQNTKTNIVWSYGVGRDAALTVVHSVPVASLPAGLLTSGIGPMAKLQKLTGGTNRDVLLDRVRFAVAE